MASIKLSALISRLRDEGVTHVEINYSGSGDSGSVEDVYITKGNSSKDYNQEEADRLHAIFDAELQDLGYHILENHYSWDWYNNEGGYGSVGINVATSDISINGYVREVVDASTEVDIEQINY